MKFIIKKINFEVPKSYGILDIVKYVLIIQYDSGLMDYITSTSYKDAKEMTASINKGALCEAICKRDRISTNYFKYFKFFDEKFKDLKL